MCAYYVSRLSGCIYMLIISARIADRSKGFILAQRECTVHSLYSTERYGSVYGGGSSCLLHGIGHVTMC